MCAMCSSKPLLRCAMTVAPPRLLPTRSSALHPPTDRCMKHPEEKKWTVVVQTYWNFHQALKHIIPISQITRISQIDVAFCGSCVFLVLWIVRFREKKTRLFGEPSVQGLRFFLRKFELLFCLVSKKKIGRDFW